MLLLVLLAALAAVGAAQDDAGSLFLAGVDQDLANFEQALPPDDTTG